MVKYGTFAYILAHFSANIQQNRNIVMGKSTLRLDTRRALKDGTYPIQIVVGHGTNIYLSTGIYASISEWDNLTKQFVGKGNKRVNNILATMLASITARIFELKENGQWQKLSRPQIKQMLTNLDLISPTVDVPTLGMAFDNLEDVKSESTRQIVVNARKKLVAFCGDLNNIQFNDISRVWLDDFYKSMATLSVNSKSLYMQILRKAIYWAIDREYTTNNPFRHYHIKSEETRMRVLPIEKMRTLLNLDLQYRYGEYRDLFMLTFYLIGINTVDLSKLTEDNIRNGRLEYRRAKTNKLYSIKIEPEAEEIIKRYRGKKHLLSFFDKHKNYKTFRGLVNEALSRIGPVAVNERGLAIKSENKRAIMQPLEKDLTIYWARYSWATYAADLEIPKDTISEALGHSHGAKVTGVYIKYNRDKVDEANRKVIDYVLGK